MNSENASKLYAIAGLSALFEAKYGYYYTTAHSSHLLIINQKEWQLASLSIVGRTNLDELFR